MLDTIAVQCSCRFRAPFASAQMVRIGRAIRAWPYDGGRLGAEFSLPKVLFGHNGRVLANQAEIDLALSEAAAGLATLGDIGDLNQWSIKRVDIAWNFDQRALPIIMAHTAVRIPGIRSDCTLHRGGEGISWCGANSHRKITFYDKARQMHREGSVLRVEISLRSRQLLGCGLDRRWFRFDDLYAVYRGILSAIPPILKLRPARTIYDAIAREPKETCDRVLGRLSHRSPSSYRRIRHKLRAAAAELEHTFCWASTLPESGPPAPVSVLPRQSRNSRTPVLIRRRNSAIPAPV